MAMDEKFNDMKIVPDESVKQGHFFPGEKYSQQLIGLPNSD